MSGADEGPGVHVVEDDADTRDLICEALGSVGLPTAPHADGVAFLEARRFEGPSCVLLDMRLPRMSGLAVLERLQAEADEAPPVVVVTGHADVPLTVAAFRAGAFDLIEKPLSINALLVAVERALEADRARDGRRAERRELARRLEALTRREREVLALMASGETSKEIARALDISPRTVERHREGVLAKTGARNALELAIALSEAGLRPAVDA